MSDEKKSESLVRFREHLGGFFHELLRASGITMTPGNSHERIRQIGERMARTIENASEVKAIEVIRRLQKVVAESFGKVETELNKITTLLSKHNELIGGMIETQKLQAEKIEALEVAKERNDRMRHLP